jgi:hypothetical protein
MLWNPMQRTTSRPGVTGMATAFGLIVIAFAPSCAKLDPGSYEGDGQAAAFIAETEPRPTVEIVSPARGAFLVPGPVAVQGRTTPSTKQPEPIVSINVNGESVAVGPDGIFQTTINLSPGVTTITAVATDAAGHAGTGTISVMSGEYTAADQEIPEAVLVRLNDHALPGIASVVETFIWTLDLNSLSNQPLYNGQFLGITAQLDARNPRFVDVLMDFDIEPEGMYFTVTLDRPRIDIDAQVNFGSSVIGPESIAVIADSVVATGRLNLFIRPADQRLGVEVLDFDLQIPGYQNQIQNPNLTFLEPLISGVVQRRIRSAMQDAIDARRDDLARLLDNWLAPATPFTLLGIPIGYEVRAERAEFDTFGLTLQGGFQAPLITPSALAQAAPGSFRTAGGLPVSVPNTVGFFASVDDDAINRALFAAWGNGLLDQTIDESRLQALGFALPVGTLRAEYILRVMPELSVVFGPNDPVAVRLEAMLPPIVRVTGSPDLVTAEIGELHLTLLMDRGQGFEEALHIALHGRIPATVELDTGGIRLAANGFAELTIDMVEEAAAPIDEARVETALALVLTPIIPGLLNQIPLIPLPNMGQLSVATAQGAPDGPEQDRLGITAEISR